MKKDSRVQKYSVWKEFLRISQNSQELQMV